MSTFVITGGAGFIGSNLTEALLGRGERVRVLDDFSSGRRDNLAAAASWASAGGGHFELIEGDVRDPDTCRRALTGADYVLHQAAIPSVPRSVRDPLTTNAVNVVGTLHLLEAARTAGVKRFVSASSSSLYGESETLPKHERMPLEPISPYGLQKLAAETYCRLYFRLYGLPTVALRYFNVFGPRQDPASEYAAVVPRFVAALRAGSPPVIYGDGEQTRDFTYIANVVEANLLACRAGASALGRAFNIGSGERISLNGLVERLSAVAGRPAEARHEDARPGDIRHSLADVSQAQDILGYRVLVDLDTGLRRLWDES